jgi:hypothetical protein
LLATYEALLLLAIDDGRGDPVQSLIDPLDLALAGSVLAELHQCECIQCVDGRLVVIEHDPTGDPILDQTYNRMRDAVHPRKTRYWVNDLTYARLRNEIGHQLVGKGFLARHKQRLVLRREAAPQPSEYTLAKYTHKARLREIVLANLPPRPAEVTELALLLQSGLLPLVFTVGERKAAAHQISLLGDEYQSGSPTGESLRALLESLDMH